MRPGGTYCGDGGVHHAGNAFAAATPSMRPQRASGAPAARPDSTPDTAGADGYSLAKQLSELPPWLRIFTTSREEPLIKDQLRVFEPKELRADEEKNRADVEVRWLATCNVTCLAKIRTIRTMALQTIQNYGYTELYSLWLYRLTVTMTGLSMTITDYD